MSDDESSDEELALTGSDGGVRLILDWVHVLRKVIEGKWDKYLGEAARKKGAKASIIDDIMFLRRMSSGVAFRGVFEDVISRRWTALGAEELVTHFERFYIEGWAGSWFIGYAPPGVCVTGQQALEGGHAKKMKLLVGKKALKADPKVFLGSTMPVIAKRAGDDLLAYPVSSLSFSSSGFFVSQAPLTDTVVVQAALLINRSVSFELDSKVANVRHFYVSLDPASKMTSRRARLSQDCMDYGDLLNIKIKPSAKPAEIKSKGSSILADLGCVRVVVTGVADIEESNPCFRKAGIVLDRVDGKYPSMVCHGCLDFAKGANMCRHCVLVAHEIGYLDIEKLLVTMTPSSHLPGRKRTVGGALSLLEPAGHRTTEEHFLKRIERNKAAYRRCVVAVEWPNGRGEKEIWFGYVDTLSFDEKREPWFNVKFPSDAAKEEHRISKYELASALMLARDLGALAQIEETVEHVPLLRSIQDLRSLVMAKKAASSPQQAQTHDSPPFCPRALACQTYTPC